MYIPGAGSEALMYLKPLFITPISLILTYLYLNLSSTYSQRIVFRIFIAVFGVYFISYTVLFAPYREYFALHGLADLLEKAFSTHLRFHVIIPLVRYWMDTLFYVMAELWGSTMVSLLIWGAVNQSMTISAAKNQYVFFTLGVNTSAIVAGALSVLFGSWCHGSDESHWIQFTHITMFVVCCFLILTLVLYEFLSNKKWIITQEELPSHKSLSAERPKYTLVQAIKHVYQHPRLLAIAVIVLSYNTLYTLSDFIFSSRVEMFFGAHEKIHSNSFLAKVSLATGCFAIVLALIVYPIVMRKGGWKYTALLTPFIFVGSAIVFYLMQSFELYHFAFAIYVGGSSTITLMTGAIHIALLRAAKYSVFDATKEQAYVGLPLSDQINGKAVIDAIGSRFGKSLGSYIIFILFSIFGSQVSSIFPYVILSGVLMVLYWIHSILVLDRACHSNVNQMDNAQHLVAVHS